MKYFIVYYCLSVTFTIPCPTKKIIDIFSLENHAYCNCLSYQKKQVIDYDIDKKFTSLDSSLIYYNRIKSIGYDSVRILIY